MCLAERKQTKKLGSKWHSGDDWNLNPQILKELEQFTCLMYGHNRETSVDIVRPKLLRKMVGEDEKLTSKSKVDLTRLPPLHAALKPHVQRVNHHVALYKRNWPGYSAKAKTLWLCAGIEKRSVGIGVILWSCPTNVAGWYPMHHCSWGGWEWGVRVRLW